MINPTTKQKIAFSKVVKGSSISKAMREVGYAESTSKRSNKLTRSQGWEFLMRKHLPDATLAKKHKELLNKTEKIVVGIGQGHSEIKDTGQPHSDAVKALDIAYKLKSRYGSDPASNKVLIINITAEAAQKYGIKTQ